MKELIENRLNCLIGLPLLKMGRAANLIWLGFGNGVKFQDKEGRDILIGEFAIHIQSCWRVLQK